MAKVTFLLSVDQVKTANEIAREFIDTLPRYLKTQQDLDKAREGLGTVLMKAAQVAFDASQDVQQRGFAFDALCDPIRVAIVTKYEKEAGSVLEAARNVFRVMKSNIRATLITAPIIDGKVIQPKNASFSAFKKAGTKPRQSTPRQSQGTPATATDQAADTLKLHPAVAVALNALIKEMKEAYQDDALKVATIIDEAAKAIGKVTEETTAKLTADKAQTETKPEAQAEEVKAEQPKRRVNRRRAA